MSKSVDVQNDEVVDEVIENEVEEEEVEVEVKPKSKSVKSKSTKSVKKSQITLQEEEIKRANESLENKKLINSAMQFVERYNDNVVNKYKDAGILPEELTKVKETYSLDSYDEDYVLVAGLMKHDTIHHFFKDKYNLKYIPSSQVNDINKFLSTPIDSDNLQERKDELERAYIACEYAIENKYNDVKREVANKVNSNQSNNDSNDDGAKLFRLAKILKTQGYKSYSEELDKTEFKGWSKNK